ncbi:MAG TPA: hypothetical protein VES42_27175 [Pilimelia sp.]|nr:hypothetical protein [Pilimelia sp.]
MRKPTKLVVAFAATLVTVGIASAAWAYWQASGTGTATATAATAKVLRIDAVGSLPGRLYPGGSTDLRITVTNENPYPIQVDLVQPNGAITADKPGCVNHGVTLAERADVGWELAANDDDVLVLAGAVSMPANAPNACQGATFTIPVRLFGGSNA